MYTSESFEKTLPYGHENIEFLFGLQCRIKCFDLQPCTGDEMLKFYLYPRKLRYGQGSALNISRGFISLAVPAFPCHQRGENEQKNQKIGPEQSPQLPGRASPAGPALPQHYRALNSRFSLFTVELPGGVCSAAASACWEKSGKIRAGAALFVFTWI